MGESRLGRILPMFGDVVGVGVMLALLVRAADVMGTAQPGDLRVYHQAVEHLLSDDVFEHRYPEWPFTYPPSALVILGFTALPWPVIRVLMALLTGGACLVTMALTMRRAAPGTAWTRPGPVAGASAVMFLAPATAHGMLMGQAAPLVLALTAIAAFGQRPVRAGVLMAVAIAVKLTPALFVVHWAHMGERRRVITAVLTFAGITTGAALVMPHSTWWYFGQGGVLRAEQSYASPSNQAIAGTLARLGWDSALGRVVALALALALLPWALSVARRMRERGRMAVAVPLVGVWSGLAAPLAWVHAFGWWVPLGVAIALTGRRALDLAIAGVAVVGPSLMWTLHLGFPASGGALASLWLANHLIVGLLVTALLDLTTRSRPGAAAPITEDLALAGPRT